MAEGAKLFALGIASIVGAVVNIFVGSLLIWLGAALAGIRRATFSKALATAILASILWWIVPAIFFKVPCLGYIVGVIIAFLGSLGIVVVVFNCTLAKALTAWILYIVSFAIAQVVLWPFR